MLTGQVFVSRTSDMAVFPEGRSFVRAALDGIVRAGMAPVDMEYFAARDGQPADYCRDRVRRCEVYLAVVGFRYGSVVPGEAISYTELEFAEAGAAGLPRLVFLLDDTAAGPADADRGAVDRFRERLRAAGLITAGFGAAGELELAVYQALMEGALPGGGRAAPGVRFSLPPDVAAFTGRVGELEQVTAAVTGASAGGVVTIRAIGGMPGVGKTALAVHAAHLLRGVFPDRQLFIDLHAHTPGRDAVKPEDALAGLLAATGVDPRFLPADLDGRAAMWRDKMTGQRALLVLDNAASTSQVTPLLPAGGDCLVLITSRRHLGDLAGPIVPVLVDALPAGPAQQMFTRLAPRAAADPAGVTQVVHLAGYLPLAISLLARVFVRHPAWTLADLAAETRDRLLTLTAENDTIAAAFAVSYGHLDPARQWFFRLLGLHPGATTDTHAAAALAGVTTAQAAGLLDGLHGEGLLTESGYRRYGMHDLLRRYAQDHAAAGSATERGQALDRLLDYYQHTAARAGARLARLTRPGSSPASPATLPAGPDLEEADQALMWARADRASLLGCLDLTVRTGQHARVAALTAGLAALLERDGPWAEAAIRHAAAIRAAQQARDRLGEANALADLGHLQYLTGDYPGAAGVLEKALAIYRNLGDQLGEASAQRDLGHLRYLAGDYPGAARLMERALAIYRNLRDQLGQSDALRDLGTVRQAMGDYAGASQILEEALHISSQLGDRRGQANALNILGAVRRLTGDYPGTARVMEQALGIYRDLGDRLGEASVLSDLGAVLQATGDYPRARQILDDALAIYRDLGDRLGEASALHILGIVRQQTGDYPGASQVVEHALGIYQDLGSRLGEANALSALGAVRRLTGQYPAAADALDKALSIYRDLGDRQGQAETLNEHGTLDRTRGDLARARNCHQQARELARLIGSAQDEAHALAGLGRCALASGRPAEARALLRQAQRIFDKTGAAETSNIHAELDTLARLRQPSKTSQDTGPQSTQKSEAKD